MRVLRRADLIAVKWKNGGGITRNIATGMHGETTVWRVSRADVDVEGPFSDFAGLTRILTVVSPNAMDLVHEDGVLEARSWQPLVFDGGLNVESRLLDGPLTDLNLMFDPKHCVATVEVRRGPCNISAPKKGAISVLHVLAGHPRSGSEHFGEADTLFVEASDQALIELGHDDAVLELVIWPTDQSTDMRLCIAER